MRFVLAFLAAVVVSVLLFLMMYKLINEDAGYVVKDQPVLVDITRTRTIEKKLEQKKQVQEAEPKLEALTVSPPIAAITPNIDIQMPQVVIEQRQQQLNIEQKYWSQPTGGEGTGTDYIGERENTNRAVVPVSTRMPNIPQVAFDNRINGWVLLAFSVTAKGKVESIRVMDAYPRGVFEANAIAAVRGWYYQPFEGEDQYISQRIEFLWENYHYNMDIK